MRVAMLFCRQPDCLHGAAAQCGGDEEFLRELLGDLKEEVTENTSTVTKALSSKEEVRRLSKSCVCKLARSGAQASAQLEGVLLATTTPEQGLAASTSATPASLRTTCDLISLPPPHRSRCARSARAITGVGRHDPPVWARHQGRHGNPHVPPGDIRQNSPRTGRGGSRP